MVLSAFAMFWFQSPSWLGFQRRMESDCGQSNMSTIFGVDKIPTDNCIRNTLDSLQPSSFNPAFYDLLDHAEETNVLSKFAVFGDRYLFAADGVESVNSSKVRCENCSTRTHVKNGQVEYFHRLLGVAVCSPKTGSEVILLPPEMIEPQDGDSKQDTETKAFKRWMDNHYDKLSRLNPIFLLDALYGNDVITKLIKGQGGSFIIACKEGSQKNIFSYLEGVELEKYTVAFKDKETGKKYLREYSWMANIPLTSDKNSTVVNYIELKETKLLTDEQKKRREGKEADTRARVEAKMAEQAAKTGKAAAGLPSRNKENRDTTTYTFFTDIEPNQSNIAELFECARNRWRVENGFNSLKTRGYNFEHNFGHGKINLANVLAAIMLIAFSCHTLLGLINEHYKNARALFSAHRSFVGDIATLTSYIIFKDMTSVMLFIEEGKKNKFIANRTYGAWEIVQEVPLP
jgi:hypothetical protein